MSEYASASERKDGAPRAVSRPHLFTFAQPPEPMLLESGAGLGPISLAYETLGELSPQRDNAVLICHALTGDGHVSGIREGRGEDDSPGWWEGMVGPGRPVDTEKYFVVCSNILGSCMGSTGPASPNAFLGTQTPYGLDFPVVTIGDMVRAQRRLMDHLGIRRWLAVVGGSVGGMQVLEWSVRYPERVAAAVPLATTMRHTALNIAFHEVARQAIMADPKWRGGEYYGTGEKPDLGLAVARMIGHITYLSDESMRLKFGRRLQDRTDFTFDFNLGLPDFQVESYLRHQGKKFVERFDANSFLYITKAADYFDLARQHGGGSAAAAFSKASCRYLVLAFSSDWLYPPGASREMVKAMKKNNLDVSFCELTADWGHDAFLLKNERLFDMVRDFLAATREREANPACAPKYGSPETC